MLAEPVCGLNATVACRMFSGHLVSGAHHCSVLPPMTIITSAAV
jgi:hypothetical protein